MSIPRVALEAVLDDLRAKRDTLLANLAAFDSCITTLEQLYPMEVRALTPNKIAPSQGIRVRLEHHGPTATCDTPQEALALAEGLRKGTPSNLPTMVEALEQAAAEAKHNRVNLIKRAQELREGSLYSSLATQTGLMLRQGKLHMGDDLIVRLIKDGKIVGLPALTKEEESGSKHVHPQYQTN